MNKSYPDLLPRQQPSEWPSHSCQTVKMQTDIIKDRVQYLEAEKPAGIRVKAPQRRPSNSLAPHYCLQGTGQRDTQQEADKLCFRELQPCLVKEKCVSTSQEEPETYGFNKSERCGTGESNCSWTFRSCPAWCCLEITDSQFYFCTLELWMQLQKNLLKFMNILYS